MNSPYHAPLFFKALTLDYNDWISGQYIGLGTPVMYSNYKTKTFVHPETLCQHIGLEDRNHLNIFGGDIVMWKGKGYSHICTVIYDPIEFCGWVLLCPLNPGYVPIGRNGAKPSELEIIGNMHTHDIVPDGHIVKVVKK